MRIPSGVTDQYIYFVAVDDTDGSTRETGLSSFTVYRSRNGAAAAAMTTPTINEVSSANMPGVYELLLDEDMTIGAGNDSEEMVFHITHAGMRAVTRSIELYRSISDVVWDEARSGHTTQGTFGESMSAIVSGTVDNTVTPTTTVFEADDITEATADHYNGRIVIFTSGVLSGQAADISDYALVSGRGRFTVTEMTDAPGNNDTFVIV